MKTHRLIQISLAIFVFALDVKVRARVIELPHGCVKAQSACAVLNLSGVFENKVSWGTFRVGEGSSYVLNEDKQVRLVRGHFLVDAHEPVEVSTLYGFFKIKSGRVFFDVKDQIINFTNISSDLSYQPRGDVQKYDLPQGFANYLTQISSNGVAETGFPKVAELKPLVKGWGELYGKTELQLFKTQLKTFSVVWTKAQKIVGPWYTATVEREVAEEKAEEARQAAIRERTRKENERWKSMFRERNYLGVDPGETHD